MGGRNMGIIAKAAQEILGTAPHKVTEYIDIFDDEGKRITSLPVSKGKTAEEVRKEAQEKYPDNTAVATSIEDHRLYVSGGYTYDAASGAPKAPPEPTAEELADQKAQQESYEAQATLNAIQTKATRMMLAGGNVTAAQNEYQVALMSISDDAALKMPDYFPTWDGNGHSYAAGDRVVYNDVLYKVLQDHTSQSDWTPDAAPSLFARVLTSTTGEPLPWEQPDSTNPYMTGDRVTYNGKVYESTQDNNVWAPDAYPQGWKEIEV